MKDRTASVLETVGQCSPQEKDAILLELLREKWNREGRKSELIIESTAKQSVGVYFPIIEPAAQSTIPAFPPDVIADIQEAIDSPNDLFTTAEVEEYVYQEVLRKRAKP
jgi:hypothetical protein